MSESLETVRETLRREGAAVLALADRIGEEVACAVGYLDQCRGRVIASGMGKAGYIARKAVGTFVSTGTPAVYIHPAEAWHGDLGMITSADVALLLSYSGETEEVLRLLPIFQRQAVPLLAITRRRDSSLGRQSTCVIELAIDREADDECPAPTCSTTAMLALCDGLAIALMRRRGLTREQFALLHPGGHIGRKLLLSVGDLMRSGGELPLVQRETPLRETIVAMSRGGMGAVIVADTGGRLEGIFTDGDLRRTLERSANPLSEPLLKFMTRNPRTADASELAVRALQRMQTHSITLLPVVDGAGHVQGVVRLHDLVKAQLV